MNIVLTPVNNLYAPAALDERVLNSYNLLKYCEINRCKRKSSMLLNKLTPTPPPSLSLSHIQFIVNVISIYRASKMSTSFPPKCSQQVEFKQEHTVEQSKSNLNQKKQKKTDVKYFVNCTLLIRRTDL